MTEPRTADEIFFRKVRAIARYMVDRDCPAADAGETMGECERESCPAYIRDADSDDQRVLGMGGCAVLWLCELTGLTDREDDALRWDEDE